jgi:hypothetical protein
LDVRAASAARRQQRAAAVAVGDVVPVRSDVILDDRECVLFECDPSFTVAFLFEWGVGAWPVPDSKVRSVLVVVDDVPYIERSDPAAA